MLLFHFSDDAEIGMFSPRKVRIPVQRRAGYEWLNGPLVWAISDAFAFLYLFPRECPRIVVWPTASSTAEDVSSWLGVHTAKAVAFVERDWLERLQTSTIYRYTLPANEFEDVGDIGMHVARTSIAPLLVDPITHLPERLNKAGVELRIVESLLPLRGVWKSSLHASGIRLRNAVGWGEPGWPHSGPA